MHSSGEGRAVLATGLLLVAVAGAGCGGERVNPAFDQEPLTTVGRVEGTDVAISVVSGDAGSVAYLCGGPATVDSWTRWLEGDADHLEDSDGQGWSVEIDEGGITGWVRPPGEAARRWAGAAASGDAGLYSTLDEGCRTGVVVDPAGSAQGVWCSKQGTNQGYLEQVTPVTPISKAGFLVEVQLVTGIRELSVLPFGAVELYQH